MRAQEHKLKMMMFWTRNTDDSFKPKYLKSHSKQLLQRIFFDQTIGNIFLGPRTSSFVQANGVKYEVWSPE